MIGVAGAGEREACRHALAEARVARGARARVALLEQVEHLDRRSPRAGASEFGEEADASAGAAVDNLRLAGGEAAAPPSALPSVPVKMSITSTPFTAARPVTDNRLAWLSSTITSALHFWRARSQSNPGER